MLAVLSTTASAPSVQMPTQWNVQFTLTAMKITAILWMPDLVTADHIWELLTWKYIQTNNFIIMSLPQNLNFGTDNKYNYFLKGSFGASLIAQFGKESTCNAGEPSSIPGLGRSAGEGIGYLLQYSWASLVAQLVKNPPAMQEIWVWFLGWEDPLEKGKATHSSILAWRIPWSIESMGSQRVRHDWATFTSFSRDHFLCVSTKTFFLVKLNPLRKGKSSFK